MNSIAVRTLAALLLLAAGHAWAGEAAPAAADPALEKRVMELSAELRCLVCQNQSLADSNAGLAVDLRNEIREKMKQGESEAQIVDFMVARYGDFVLYRPPMKAATVLLWFGPVLLVVLGFVVLFRRLQQRRAAAAAELSAAERERAARLLEVGSEAQLK
jgi:cytochrome c-type biogenesis protein CcmH